MKQILTRLTVLFSALVLLGGCATYNKAKPYPSTVSSSSASVSSDSPSHWNQPVGAYYNEGHRVVFNGYQKGQETCVMFGVVGVLVADSANRSVGNGLFAKTLNNSTFDIVGETKTLLEKTLAANPASTLVIADGGKTTDASLEIMPYVLVDFEGRGAPGRAYAIMSLRLTDKSGKMLWNTQILSEAPAEFNMDPNGEWDRDSLFDSSIKTAVERAVSVLVDDAAGKLAGKRTVLVSGRLGWVQKIGGMRAVVAAETDDYYVLRMMVPDGFMFAGIQIVSRKDVTLTDSTFAIPAK